ncbi:phage major capsid protein [Sporolactobacillus sp. CQH2019]|uniref:phage major capsid protein n=1 Tax=Sporolactobacillus sp. CQH2019 TaxID=3023512 RepID=UPI002367F168|nr:phage major capsid protein [Sporolactobacillus sp. CQH2019]MDD9147352.1 phage major capsid protein [Sporolactobacillus sp. CQH2019]
MTIAERITSKKKELAEKRAALNKKVKETRAAVAADDSTLSADDIKKLQAQITILEQDCQKCCDDLDALENINPLLQDPNEKGGTDSDMDDSSASDINGSDEEQNSAQANQSAQNTQAAQAAQKNARSFRVKDEIRGMDPNKINGQPVGSHVNTNKTPLSDIRSYETWLRSYGERRDAGLISTGNEAVTPVAFLKPSFQPQPEHTLASIVNRQSVSTRTGHFPVFKRQVNPLVTAAELAANPAVANPALIDILYDVQTYRGELDISQEMVDDSSFDITGYVNQYITFARDLTEQYALGKLFFIGDATHVLTPTAANSLADIKTAYDATLNIAYAPFRQFVVTQSGFALLDSMTDAIGRPLLQPVISDASQKTLFGSPITVIQDVAANGTNGSKLLWIGDPKSYAFEAFRNQMTSAFFWSPNFEQRLAIFYRFDAKIADNEAGITLDLTNFKTQSTVTTVTGA